MIHFDLSIVTKFAWYNVILVRNFLTVVRMYKALIEKKNAAKRKTGVKFGSFSSEGGKGKKN